MGEAKDSFPLIPSERADDLHNLDIIDFADLILFMAGNQFMVMEEIVSAFKKEYPDIQKIFYQTLPPGLQLKQILAKGAHFRGKILRIVPDIYTCVDEKAMKILEDKGFIDHGNYQLYLHNRLILMVPKNNPAGIRFVSDLAKDMIRISQPDPENEDIAFHIIQMYRQAGGEVLVKRIMEEKRGEGTTILTIVHHRETPLRIKKQTVDVGPVWATEVIHAKKSGLEFDVVEPGENLDQRNRINYYISRLKKSPNPENAGKFLDFIRSSTAQRIYRNHGFVPGFLNMGRMNE